MDVETMRTWVASSLNNAPADAVLDVDERLRLLSFPPSASRKGCAICFVSPSLAMDGRGMHEALGDLVDPLPFITFVGPSVFHDQRVPEKRPGLVVAILEDVDAEVRHTLWDPHGMPMAANLLADSMVPTARILSVSPTTAGGGLDVLAAVDEAGGDVIGALGHRRQYLKPGISMMGLGGVRFITAVAQAARQLGPTRVVTSVSNNTIRELDGHPAFSQLMADLPGQLRQQLSRLGGSLFAAIGDEDGEPVLRSITGVDPRAGSIVVADQPKVGAELAFSLRDQVAARADLEHALTSLEEALGDRRPALFLVTSSSARDAALLGAPLWDVTRVLSRFGPDTPVVGCSAAGELARLGGKTLVLGHTVVVTAVIAG